MDDLRCRLGYDWFVAQGIDSARVKVSLLSDGTATYNNFYNYFGDPATAQQNWDAYAAEVEALDWNHGGRYPETRAEFELESWTWPYYLATRPGYRLVMQNGSLLESSCPFITDKLREMQIEDIQPYEMLSTLPESARRLFYDMAGFDYDKFAALFDASPKGNLIIIGTSHQNAASEQQQRDYVARIVEQYGAAYDIFFKPHRRHLFGVVRNRLSGADAASRSDAVRDFRLVADGSRRYDRRLSLDGFPDGARR